jgi:outer membrane phospholipase A
MSRGHSNAIGREREDRVRWLGLVPLLFLVAAPARAGYDTDCERHRKIERLEGKKIVRKTICVYEPNTVGFTWDSDDVAFMDFKLSFRYQLFPVYLTRLLNRVHPETGENTALYFAFTGRFGQYIGTRESSPVVGKRYNPKLIFRSWTDNDCQDPDKPCHQNYIDVAFAHESNGQSINSPALLQAARDQATAVDGRPEFANDQLSRGWDYVEVTLKRQEWLTDVPMPKNYKANLTFYASAKYFLDRGPLQDDAEEYNDWENDPEGKPRRYVDGLSLAAKGIVFDNGHRYKYFIALTTGFHEPFQYNTLRAELGIAQLEVPFFLWWQSGYNSDLAQYYKKVHSVGLGIEIGGFL